MTVAADSRPLAFIDLAAQQKALAEPLREAIDTVLAHGQYILGPEVDQLEQALSDFCGVRHTITCANGTDALVLGLRALGVEPGDTVICPSFTFCATAEAVVLVGATPLFVDIEEGTFNLDVQSVRDAIAFARVRGMRLVGVIGVDTFGTPADYDALERVANDEGLWLMVDAAQSFGARRDGRAVGTRGALTTTSFFPAKPLGCYGDGGAIFTEDPEHDALLRSLRLHGAGAHKYDHQRIGTNSRLDTMQAAILLVKLAAFPGELERRQQVADRYAESLHDLLVPPQLPAGASSSWAQYTVLLPEGTDRAALQRTLQEHATPTAVYYANPLHVQTAYRSYPAVPCPCTESIADRVLSLPMHPYLDESDQERVVMALQRTLRC